MKNVLTFLAISISINAFSQGYSLDWVSAIGSTAGPGSLSNSMAYGANGEVYLTGYFQSLGGAMDFDPGPGVFNMTANGSDDCFVLKLDADGNFVWAVSFGDIGDTKGQGIAVDSQGNVLVTGRFGGTVDFDPGVGVQNVSAVANADAFTLKLDPSGNFIWVTTIGGQDKQEGWNIATDANDNVITYGIFNQGNLNPIDADPGPGTYDLYSSGTNTPFIQKLDPSGNFIWARSIDCSTGSVEVHIGLTLNAAGDVFVSGTYADDFDADPGIGVTDLVTQGGSGAFIIKWDVSGNFVWASGLGGTNTGVRAHDLAMDNMGNLIVTGSFGGTVDFDPGAPILNVTNNNGAIDGYAVKLDANGDLLWVYNLQGIGPRSIDAVGFDQNGMVYLSGYFAGVGTLDVDPGPDVFELDNTTQGGGTTPFLIKLNTAGGLIWAGQLGNGVSQSVAYDLNITDLEEIYITGAYSEVVDFDPGPQIFQIDGGGLADAFVVKLKPCISNSSIDVVEACGPYTWIDGIEYTTNNDSATFFMVNISGCDSTITLDLTITEIDVSTTTDDPTITANATGATYQWLDCDNGYAIVSGATMQDFTPSMNGNFAVEVTENNCADTSACVMINTVGIDEQDPLALVGLQPNPTNGISTLVLGDLDGVSVRVLDLTGRVVYWQEEVRGSELILDRIGPAGQYVVEVSHQGWTRFLSLLKL